MKTYKVLAAKTQDHILRHLGCDVEYEFDTKKEAINRAKYYLTERYRQAAEASECLGYSQVLDENGECVADFFKKD